MTRILLRASTEHILIVRGLRAQETDQGPPRPSRISPQLEPRQTSFINRQSLEVLYITNCYYNLFIQLTFQTFVRHIPYYSPSLYSGDTPLRSID